jgi:aspartyl/asparaginyl-tRNA synthetase
MAVRKPLPQWGLPAHSGQLQRGKLLADAPRLTARGRRQADAEGYNLIAEKAVSTGAAVLVKGELVESPGGNQAVELAATSVELIGACPSDYPLQKKVRAPHASSN